MFASTLVHADYRQDYARAIEAYKSGNLAEAQKLFADAVAEHPQPVVRLKLYGIRFEPYVPQHYLGLIAAQSGDCGRARAQWNAAGNAAVVAEIGVAANEKCAGSVAQNRPATPAPTTTPTTSASPPVASAPAAPTPQRPIPQAQVEPTKPVAGPPVVAKAPSPPPPSRSAESPPDKAGPPEPLLNAFQSYLSGRLTEVSRINPDAFADARARFQAYLVRGGARFTLAKLSGDEAQLESARADVRSARQLNAGATPDATLFSPRFREFYAETR